MAHLSPLADSMPAGLFGDFVTLLCAPEKHLSVFLRMLRHTGVETPFRSKQPRSEPVGAAAESKLQRWVEANTHGVAALLWLRLNRAVPVALEELSGGNEVRATNMESMGSALMHGGLSKRVAAPVCQLLCGEGVYKLSQQAASKRSSQTRKLRGKGTRASVALLQAKEADLEEQWWASYHFDNYAHVYSARSTKLLQGGTGRYDARWTIWGRTFTKVPTASMHVSAPVQSVWPDNSVDICARKVGHDVYEYLQQTFV